MIRGIISFFSTIFSSIFFFESSAAAQTSVTMGQRVHDFQSPLFSPPAFCSFCGSRLVVWTPESGVPMVRITFSG